MSRTMLHARSAAALVLRRTPATPVAVSIPIRQRLPLQQRCSSSMNPQLSPGTDETAVRPALQALLDSNGGRWTLTSEGRALERSFKFKTFAKTWDFMTAVSLQCKTNNHHPEWSNIYNTTFIRWTTHDPKGLSQKDISLAAACDALARDFGEQAPEPLSCEARGLADRVAAVGGDCCTPKKVS